MTPLKFPTIIPWNYSGNSREFLRSHSEKLLENIFTWIVILVEETFLFTKTENSYFGYCIRLVINRLLRAGFMEIIIKLKSGCVIRIV